MSNSAPDRLRQWLRARLGPLLSVATFGRFVSVGILGAVADTAALSVAILVLGVGELAAKIAGIEVAILVMFLLNERWTFTDQGEGGHWPSLARLGKSHLVRAGGSAIQLGVFWALIQPYRIRVAVGGTDVWVLLASLASIAVATVVNYVFEGLFTWQVGTTGSPSTSGEASD
jgi:Predicted membrane protein